MRLSIFSYIYGHYVSSPRKYLYVFAHFYGLLFCSDNLDLQKLQKWYRVFLYTRHPASPYVNILCQPRIFIKTKQLSLVKYYYIKYRSYQIFHKFLFENLVQDPTFQLSCHCSFSNSCQFLSLIFHDLCFFVEEYWSVILQKFVQLGFVSYSSRLD